MPAPMTAVRGVSLIHCRSSVVWPDIISGFDVRQWSLTSVKCWSGYLGAMADIDYPSADGPLPGYLAIPAGDGPWPGVVVVHDATAPNYGILATPS